MAAQVEGHDVLLHASIGAGKTGIAAGPHLLLSSKGKVTLVVSPLILLHEEQVITFKEEFGLEAMSVNSANGGALKETMAKIVQGQWQIVLLSPEMILSCCFIDNVLRKPGFGLRCLSLFIDEAHCVSHWGNSFCKKYGSLGIIRAFLPKSTPLIAVTATLTPHVHKDLVTKLQFERDNYLFLSIGNDCSNVSQVVHALEHPMNSYHDIDFVIPDNMCTPSDIKKTFVYADDINIGTELIDHLNGLVKLNNILDINLVVQWKVPTNVSSWVQRAGQAARGPGRQGLAIMLVEKSAFEIDIRVAQES
ncbi:hypothetical protein C0991_012398, partial [Blastosporella zonata]